MKFFGRGWGGLATPVYSQCNWSLTRSAFAASVFFCSTTLLITAWLWSWLTILSLAAHQTASLIYPASHLLWSSC